MTPHVDPQVLAMLAEGRLRRAKIPPVLAHIEQCERCAVAFEAAAESIEEEPPLAAPATTTRARPWLLAIAAALAVVAITVPLLLRDRADGVQRLVALAPRSARVVAPRLSGGFAWAAYRGPMRAEDRGVATEQLRLAGAAAEAIDRADRERTAAADHEAALALLLIEKPLEAEMRLMHAITLEDGDARIWSDLAAARLAIADLQGRPSLLPRALAAADRAIELDPRLAEALFNRALIVERMGLVNEARAAWQAYLAVDGSSDWAREARERLRKLPAQSGDFRREQPRLEQAAANHDANAIAAIVAAYPLQSRTYGETWYLGHWAKALQRGDAAAERHLDTARAIADALAARSGESLLRDSVRAIDEARNRARLAAAHARYYDGRLAYSRMKPAAAERDLRAAAALFANTPMAFAARYYAANTSNDQGAVTRARGELTQLLGELPARYLALRAQIRWQLGLSHILDGDWDSALPPLITGADEFRRLGERAHAAFLDSLAADTLASLGRADEAWTSRMRALAVLSVDPIGDRLPVSLGAAARMELRAGDREAALPLLRLEEAETRRARNDTLLANALVRMAVLRNELGQDAAALRAVAEAESVAARIEDPALRNRARADVAFATASVVLRQDPRRARELAGNAIEVYRAYELPIFLPEAYLVRARAARAVGDEQEAMRDLDGGLAAFERHRVRHAESVDGTGVLDAGSALIEEAITMSLARNDVAAALAYAERSRAQTLDVRALQRKLAGTRTAVVELVALPRELVAFCVTADRVSVARTNDTRGGLVPPVSRGDDRELYDLLLRPSEAAFANAEQLIIVADPLLASVPFAALLDDATNRRLVEKLSVALAPSAAALQREHPSALPSLLAVTLPSGTRAALPESEREAGDIAALYAQSRRIAGKDATIDAFAAAVRDAGIVHIAGHTTREQGAGHAALVFASGERASWQRMAAMRFAPRSVVVLAACETLRAPSAARPRAFTLGDGAIAAGAAEVIGTLTPIPDADAREIFAAVHRNLASGAGAAEAVRQAQLARLRDANVWRAVTVLTTRISEGGAHD